MHDEVNIWAFCHHKHEGLEPCVLLLLCKDRQANRPNKACRVKVGETGGKRKKLKS